MKEYTSKVIRVGDRYITGFDRIHAIVQFTTREDGAKLFDNTTHARDWLETYSDAGFGLQRSHAEIVEAGESALRGYMARQR